MNEYDVWLLMAKADVEESKNKNGLAALLLLLRGVWWDRNKQLYYYQGKAINPLYVKAQLSEYIDAYSVKARNKLDKGTIFNIERMAMEAVWVTAMTATAAAVGGWANISAAHIALIIEEITKPGGSLQRALALIEGLKDGSIPLDGRVIQRILGYAKSALLLYELIRRLEMQAATGMPLEKREAANKAQLLQIEYNAALAAGASDAELEEIRGEIDGLIALAAYGGEERNILGIAEHCASCIRETKRGWVPIGTLIPVGLRDCWFGCKCTVGYRSV